METSGAKSTIVDLLPSHQLESSIVTKDEILFVRRWVDMVSPNGISFSNNWLDGWIDTTFPFSFRYGDKESGLLLCQSNWDRGNRSTTNRQEYIWTDAATGLRLTWSIRRFSDYPAVEWVLIFENSGTDDTPVIEDIQSLDLHLKHSLRGHPYIIHGVTGGRSFPDDMMPFSWQVPSVEGKNDVSLGGDYPSSNRHLPFFNLETPEDRGVLIGIGWSGNWLAQIKELALTKVKVDGSELRVRAGLKESHFVLHPGEQVRTPRILLLFWKGKRLHGHNMLRQLLYKHYVPRLRGKPQKPLVSVNVCFTYHGHGGFLHQATEKEVLPLIEPFTRIGAELFIIDAGWYEGEPWTDWLGNWQFSKKKYPRGFRPISEQLASSGIAFGLWFAPENVSQTAPLLKEHPEWVRDGTLRMELPQAREWFLKQVNDLVEKEGMNCYRQDGAGGFGDEPPDRKGISQCQHIAGLYAMWDALVKHHKNIIMEGCCGGGRRIDLETLSRFHWHQKSDRWYDSESDQCSLYGANLYLPGGLINIPTEAIDDYGAWSSFAGQFCLSWHPLDADFPMELACKQVLHFKRIRSLLSGDFYPLTPCSLSEPWIGYQFHRIDTDKGFALLFRRPNSKGIIHPVADSFKLCLRGLEPEGHYRVHFERSGKDEILTGATLSKGIEIVIDVEKSAEMVIYERKL